MKLNTARTIKVLHVYKTYYPDTVGGVEAVIEQICTASQALGIQSQVLTLSQETHPIEHNSITVHRAHLDLELASTGFSWQFIFMLSALAKDVDVVHYHFPHQRANEAVLDPRAVLHRARRLQSEAVGGQSSGWTLGSQWEPRAQLRESQRYRHRAGGGDGGRRCFC